MANTNQFSVFLNETGNQPLYGDTLNDSSKKINGILWSLGAGSAAAQTGGGAASTTASALPSRVDRIDWGIQNLSTSTLYVKLGDGASLTNFDQILNGGSSQDDGLGGVWSVGNWKGSVSIYSASPRYKVWEI